MSTSKPRKRGPNRLRAVLKEVGFILDLPVLDFVARRGQSRRLGKIVRRVCDDPAVVREFLAPRYASCGNARRLLS
ncbi:hypothetical protein HY374_00095 [Candidatus Berkelbacteria bacterium]|nr:hypothetical protein [Candidatus Berkelbacteria bacterium]